jgi:hypothetical protein
MPSFASAWFCRSFVSASSAFVERLKKEKASCLDDMAEGSLLVQNKEGPNAAPCAVDFSSRRLVSVLRFELLARYYTLW